MMRWLAALALAMTLLSGPAHAQETVHGANSTFLSPAVKLAWAVRRGATETETLVVVRIIAAEGYRFVRLDGVDPFSKDRKVFAARPLDRQADLSVPRVQFSDHPSTEFHFFASEAEAATGRAKLVVFYLGIPDTTPEFAGAREAEAYLGHALQAK